MEESRTAYGTHIFHEDIGFYEMAGLMGLDYVWIDDEHAHLTGPTIRNGIVGTNAGGCAAFVRVRNNDPAIIKPVLEIGPDGIIVPMVNTPEEAERAVKACMYPPQGIRGFGPIRGNSYSIDPDLDIGSYAERANKDILKIIQAEHFKAVESLDAILEVPGIDIVICGPMDLSASIGKIGRLNDPELMELMGLIIKKCKAAKIPCGVSVGYNMELVKFWKENKASFISVGSPYDYFRIMGLRVLNEMKSL